VGSAALELYGNAALLRSVAVDQNLRGQGLGQQLTRAALDLAGQHGVETVYLLTETATDFFPRFGFQPIARSAVAPAVQQSVEFTSACPASAAVLALDLHDGSAATRAETMESQDVIHI
jgi:amino-acid N-acetyltransferase